MCVFFLGEYLLYNNYIIDPMKKRKTFGNGSTLEWNGTSSSTVRCVVVRIVLVFEQTVQYSRVHDSSMSHVSDHNNSHSRSHTNKPQHSQRPLILHNHHYQITTKSNINTTTTTTTNQYNVTYKFKIQCLFGFRFLGQPTAFHFL